MNKISKIKMDKIIKEIDLKLEQFILDGKYKEVLISMGNLSHYSFNNQMLIIMQMPNARTTYGIRKWNLLGRHIRQGEKGIKIFSPILSKRGSIDEEEYHLMGFRMQYVFDVSQTNGKELNVFMFDASKVVNEKEKIICAIKSLLTEQGFNLSYVFKEELGEDCYGLCNHKTKEIKILNTLSDLQEISTIIHECAHALAHTEERVDFKGLTSKEKREIKEVEAESISCIVCSYLGLETKNFNFSYITGWSSGDISKFRNNIGIISKYANLIIDSILNNINKGENYA